MENFKLNRKNETTEGDLKNLLSEIPVSIQETALFEAACSYLAHNALSTKGIRGLMNGVIKIEGLAKILQNSPIDSETKKLIEHNIEELKNNPEMIQKVDRYLTALADFYENM